MKKAKIIITIGLCFALGMMLLTGCGSEAKNEMDSTVEAANAVLEQGDKPYDPSTEEALKSAITSAEEAKDDDAYNKVTQEITTDLKAYEDSVKQLKQVTNPEESFILERVQTVDTITDVEAATEETDPNNLLNKEGAYKAFIAMKSSLVKDEYGLYADKSPAEVGNACGAAIEVFETEEEAEKRNAYLAAFDGAGALSPGSHTVIGTVIVRTSNELTATQQKELETSLIEALIRLEE